MSLSLQSLPSELQINIFGLLEGKELMTLACCSTDLNIHSSDPSLWKRVGKEIGALGEGKSEVLQKIRETNAIARELFKDHVVLEGDMFRQHQLNRQFTNNINLHRSPFEVTLLELKLWNAVGNANLKHIGFLLQRGAKNNAETLKRALNGGGNSEVVSFLLNNGAIPDASCCTHALKQNAPSEIVKRLSETMKRPIEKPN